MVLKHNLCTHTTMAMQMWVIQSIHSVSHSIAPSIYHSIGQLTQSFVHSFNRTHSLNEMAQPRRAIDERQQQDDTRRDNFQRLQATPTTTTTATTIRSLAYTQTHQGASKHHSFTPRTTTTIAITITTTTTTQTMGMRNTRWARTRREGWKRRRNTGGSGTSVK